MGLTFLKKLGTILATVSGIAPMFTPMAMLGGPKLQNAVSEGVSELGLIGDVIVQVETMGAAIGSKVGGADKLKAAVPSVAQIVMKSALIAGRKLDNPSLFNQGCQKMADGMVDVLNSIHEKEANVIDVTDYKIS